MKLKTSIPLLLGSAGLISAEIDTTITETVTVTKTLYTPEESLSMAEEAAKAASIASVLSVESSASVAAVQLAADAYYNSIALASIGLLAQETASLENKGYNATNDVTTHYVTVTFKPKSKVTTSASKEDEEPTLDVDTAEAQSDASSSDAVTIPAEETSKGAGFTILNKQYTGGVAGLCALLAALL